MRAAARSPTVTDADVVLGRIDPARFAGGKIALDPARAPQAVTETIGAPLAMPVHEAARGIAEIVDETMASAARVHAVENGKETSGRTLIAFGGAAPLHAARLAQKLGIRRVVVPPDAGVGSALGFLGAPIAYEVVRTLLVRLDALEQTHDRRAVCRDARRGRSGGAARRAAGRRWSRRAPASCAIAARGTRSRCRCPTAALDPAALRAAFDATYARVYGRVIPRLEVEAVTWTLSLAEPHALPTRLAPPPDAGAAPPTGQCRIVETATGETVDAALFVRADLPQGMRARRSRGDRRRRHLDHRAHRLHRAHRRRR